jgi:hypothetical protein
MIMTATLADGQARPLRPDLAPGVYHALRFSRDGKRLLVVRRHSELLEIEVASKRPPAVRWRTMVEVVESADYAGDGDGFVAGVVSYEGDLWLAEGEFP